MRIRIAQWVAYLCDMAQEWNLHLPGLLSKVVILAAVAGAVLAAIALVTVILVLAPY